MCLHACSQLSEYVLVNIRDHGTVPVPVVLHVHIQSPTREDRAVRLFIEAAFLVLVLCAGSSVHAQKSPQSLAAACERQLMMTEQSIVHVAELMPEDHYYFTPDSLHIPGSDFAGVRTFAAQVRHLASDNYDMWSIVTGEPVPPGGVGVEGPPAIRTKAAILKYLSGSFAMGHRAAATLTSDNAMDLVAFRGSKLPRLDLVFWALTHANDHYGQMVVYLRACGISPSATLPK